MLRTQGYLRVKEAAKLLGVSPNTVRAWGAAGKIPEFGTRYNATGCTSGRTWNGSTLRSSTP